ncbi:MULTISPECIES: DUF2513 domain-containing protein [Bacillus]|uniref:DUF2513 domain-containing protein n=1 Tax=Bacillus TaxID=1386 RepID=UPI000D0467D9|nr:DUF2513 domain-containing protein [Bacillus pumilus]PRS14653.1 hypothetical protein C6X95_06655 [Bacillus pumilus]
MKLHPDLVRKMLLEIEDLPYQEDYTLSAMYLLAIKNGYDDKAGVYTARKLSESGLVKGGFPDHLVIEELTFEGHMFLDSIRDESIWAQTKTLTSKFAGVSLDILKDVSTHLIKDYLKLN